MIKDIVFDLEELKLILGIRDKDEEVEKILNSNNNKETNTFLGTVSTLINNSSPELLFPSIDIDDQNEMYHNYINTFKINEDFEIAFQNSYDDCYDMEESNFSNEICGKDQILHNANINFDQLYSNKIKSTFKEINPPVVEPINYENNNKKQNDHKKISDHKKQYDNKGKNEGGSDNKQQSNDNNNNNDNEEGNTGSYKKKDKGQKKFKKSEKKEKHDEENENEEMNDTSKPEVTKESTTITINTNNNSSQINIQVNPKKKKKKPNDDEEYTHEGEVDDTYQRKPKQTYGGSYPNSNNKGMKSKKEKKNYNDFSNTNNDEGGNNANHSKKTKKKPKQNFNSPNNQSNK